MTGIWGIISAENLKMKIDLNDEFHKEPSAAYMKSSLMYTNAAFGRFSLNKFSKDKVFNHYKDKLVCTEGLILNSSEMLKAKNYNDFAIFLHKSHEQFGWQIIKEFRGNFSGFFYNINNNKLEVFTDHFSNKPIYYYYDEKTKILIFASELKVAAKALRLFELDLSLNITAAYCMITLGYMLDDMTVINGIKKLLPGHILVFDKGKINIIEYNRFTNRPELDENEEKMIEEIDKRFKTAIIIEFNKDLENGYKHAATLSGGLDSRMTVGYAKKLGFKAINCFTFSESDYYDAMIARQICSDNQFDLFCYSLDNGNYLWKYLDPMMGILEGQTLYSGSAHYYACLRGLSFHDLGIIHTGMIGEILKGTLLKGPEHMEVDNDYLDKIAYSSRVIHKLKDLVHVNKYNYDGQEIFNFYERGINAANNGSNRVGEQFSEFSSPFLNLEFVNYVLKIPPEYRFKKKLYLKWMNRCLPDFSNYMCEAFGLAPKYPIPVAYLLGGFRKKARAFLKNKESSMNPTGYWWRRNTDLRNHFSLLFEEYIHYLEPYPELMSDCKDLFNESEETEKTQVLTLLKSIELYDLKN